MKYYVLNDDYSIREANDMNEWSKFFQVGREASHLKHNFSDGSYLSTIFLGIDHGYDFNGGPPILFESMLFTGEGEEEYQERFATYAEAKASHDRYVQMREAMLNGPEPAPPTEGQKLKAKRKLILEE